MNKFISYEEFKTLNNLQFEGVPAESSFLKFKQDVSSNHGPIDSEKKYPPPIFNKKVPAWIFQTPIAMFEKTKTGSKNYRFVLRQNKTKIQLTHLGK